MDNKIETIFQNVSADVIRFAQEIVKTKSMTCQEQDVAHLVEKEMQRLGFDEIKLDGIGNVIGRIGNGKNTLLFDSHMDTVSVIDASEWTYPPFGGVIEDGKLYGRGAVDMKCPLVASVYGAYIAKCAGLSNDSTIYVSASTMEEDYDGEALRYLLETSGIHPDGVVICEPTNLRIATGHRGRALIEVHSKGVACHGSTPEKGINPVYALAPIIERIQEVASKLGKESGEHGSLALTNIYCNTASNNSVPSDATVILDRRLALGETEAKIIKEMDDMLAGTNAQWNFSDIPGTSWNGKEFLFHSFLPAWDISKDHPLVKLASDAYCNITEKDPELFRMIACTNGVSSAGMYKLPTIVFGPGDLTQAHARDEYCEVDSMLAACKIYASMCLAL